MMTLTAAPQTASQAALSCTVDSDAIQAAVDRFAVGDCWEIVCRPNGRRWALWLDWSVDLAELTELLHLAQEQDAGCVDFKAPDWEDWESAEEYDGSREPEDFYLVRYLLSVD